jgi:hypothetical protein
MGLNIRRFCDKGFGAGTYREKYTNPREYRFRRRERLEIGC